MLCIGHCWHPRFAMNKTSTNTTALQWLHLLKLDASIATQNADLIDQKAGTGALDAAAVALERGNASSAMKHLDAAVRLAARPLASSATGHAIQQRAALLTAAKSCRTLVRFRA